MVEARGARPSGTVTFLFTDIEGSTRLWESDPDAMAKALESHDAVLRESVSRHGGSIFSTAGDGFGVAFSRSADAVSAAVEAQQRLVLQQSPSGITLRVRMGLHAGETFERRGDYFGPAVNAAARLMASAHGSQIVCSGTVVDLAPDACDVLDLGPHRFRDVEATMRVFQLCAPGLPNDFPRLKSVDQHRSNIPHEVSSFVGRTRDVAAAVAAIEDARLVSIVGVGGVGKTRLALRVASAVTDAFDDGVWLCELAPVRDPSGIADAIASAVGFSPPFGVSVSVGLLEFLAQQTLLLITDNCEHIASDVASELVRLMTAAPGLKVLATSREPLAIPGERVYGLASLSVADDTTEDAVRASEAGQLFIERAYEAGSRLALDADARAIAELCRRLDGIPLALELAAARTVAMEPAELVNRLDNRFQLLTGGRHRALERHQTLRAAIDWSYMLLGPEERALLGRLSTFVGSFDLEAVVAISDRDELEAIDLLASLVAKSLVERPVDRAGRYRLLETIRQYAIERLDEDGAAVEARDRHADHFVAVARDALLALRTETDRDALEMLALETPNIAAALEWRTTKRRYDWLEMCRVVPPVVFVQLSTNVADPIVHEIEAAVSDPASADSNGFTAACTLAVICACNAGDVERAQRFISLARTSRDDVYAAYAEAMVPGVVGDMATGQGAMTAALERMTAGDDPLLRSEMLAMRALYSSADDHVGGLADAEESLTLARASGGHIALMAPLQSLTLALTRIDADAAFQAAEECLAVDPTRRRMLSINTQSFAAWALGEKGDTVRALAIHRKVIEHHAAVRNRLSFAITIATVGETIASRDPTIALELLALAECGAIAKVDLLDNAYYVRLPAIAADRGEAEVARLRTRFAEISYDEAVAFVLAAIDAAIAEAA